MGTTGTTANLQTSKRVSQIETVEQKKAAYLSLATEATGEERPFLSSGGVNTGRPIGILAPTFSRADRGGQVDGLVLYRTSTTTAHSRRRESWGLTLGHRNDVRLVVRVVHEGVLRAISVDR